MTDMHPFTALEQKLFDFLTGQNLGKLVYREEIEEHLWPGQPMYSNKVDVHIKNLRKKLNLDHRGKIETVRREGYRFTPPTGGHVV